MKITKTVKYNFQLSEGTLEKDIDSFISKARNGDYSWNYKYNMEGLKIIKQYFKILQEKFDNSEFEECKNCYHKLILFLFAASSGRDDADFGYEDLLARTKLDWEKIIKNYILCLINTSDVGELSDKISQYVISLKEYGFDSDTKTLIEELDDQTLKSLEQKMLIKTEGVTKKDEDMHDIIYFLLGIAKEQKDKEKYLGLCEKFRGVLSDNEVDSLKREYDEENASNEFLSKGSYIENINPNDSNFKEKMKYFDEN